VIIAAFVCTLMAAIWAAIEKQIPLGLLAAGLCLLMLAEHPGLH
jgi:hypothetical protein